MHEPRARRAGALAARGRGRAPRATSRSAATLVDDPDGDPVRRRACSSASTELRPVGARARRPGAARSWSTRRATRRRGSRVLEAGDRVTLAGWLPPARRVRRAAAVAPRGRRVSTPHELVALAGPAVAARAIANALRGRRAARHRRARPTAARAARRVPARRHPRPARRRRRRLPRRRALAPARGVGRERRVRPRARRAAAAAAPARRRASSLALAVLVVFGGDDPLRAVGPARVGDGRGRAAGRVTSGGPRAGCACSPSRSSALLARRSVPGALGRLPAVVRRERRDRAARRRRSRARLPGPARGCASRSAVTLGRAARACAVLVAGVRLASRSSRRPGQPARRAAAGPLTSAGCVSRRRRRRRPAPRASAPWRTPAADRVLAVACHHRWPRRGAVPLTSARSPLGVGACVGGGTSCVAAARASGSLAPCPLAVRSSDRPRLAVPPR